MGPMKKSNVVSRMVPVVFEDESLVAVVKPAGVDTGGARDGSAAGLVEWLGAVRPDGETLHVTNRLSRYESGILLLSRNRLEADRIRKELQRGRIELEYIAVVRGRMAKKSLTLSPRGKQPAVKVASSQRPGKARRGVQRRKEDATVMNGTEVYLLEQREDRALVRIRTRLENTHALRALLRGSRLRLLGDRLHELAQKPAAAKQTCLHLARMVRPQGGRERPLVIKAPSPNYAGATRGEFDMERPLLAAAARRLVCLADREIDAYRLLCGDVEDLPGLTADRYGDALILQVQEEGRYEIEQLKRIARWYLETLPVEAVYRKRFVKDRLRADADVLEELTRSRPFLGKALPPVLTIHERGLRFAIRPYDGFSVGLFLDQRDNRSFLRSIAGGKSVLNLFAYTCGFSVAAAAGGATCTASVDVSGVNLERGRENFALNNMILDKPRRSDAIDEGAFAAAPLGDVSVGPDPTASLSTNERARVAAAPLGAPVGASISPHVFVRSGAMDYLRRAGRRGDAYDIVVIDPPSYAHGRRGENRFSVMEDLPKLVASALRVLAPDGRMLVSSNHRRLTLRGLRERIHAAAGGRPYRIEATPPLPPDFAMDRDFAKSMWLRFP